jgi:outer membrane protein assembly factor BamB
MSEAIPQGPAGAISVAPVRPRVWPAVVIIVLMWMGMLIPGWLAPITMVHMFGWMLSPLVALAALALWWLFFSRVRWADRLLGLLIFTVLGAIVWVFSHSTVGGMGVFFFGIPCSITVCVLFLAATPFLNWPVRRVGLLVVLALGWLWLLVVRNDGTDGSMNADIQYRWGETAEDRFLADAAAGKLRKEPAPAAAGSLVLQPGDWPGFRGLNRDSRLTGVRITTNWTQRPPKELWRHRVGPGWSSFAVVGNRLFTQEQRSEEEVVVCYDANSGAELWAHADLARFTETMAGPGPRATPTFHEGKLYAQGATGKLNCLDPTTGKALWSRDLVSDTGAKVPDWGFSASPLITHGLVTVFSGAPEGKSVVAYRADSGEKVWEAGDAKISYCSLHQAIIAGVEQLLLTSNRGLTAFNPTSGQVLWHHDWNVEGMARVVQPTPVDEYDFLIGTSFGLGTRRVHVHQEGGHWTTEEVWTTPALKPYYNDQVVFGDHVYGFDNNLLTCVSLADGKAAWKERGYGNGQILLLVDQGLLLVLSEKGEIALVEARPEAHKQLGRFQAVTGKTWNHPVIAHGKLFVRNGEEAVCYELAQEGENAGK